MFTLRSSLHSTFGVLRLRCLAQHKPRHARFIQLGKADVPTVYKPRRDSWINPTILLVGFMPFFTFALGTWQLQRLQWKVALIDELEEKLQLPPLLLPPKIKYDLRILFIFLTSDIIPICPVYLPYLILSTEKSL